MTVLTELEQIRKGNHRPQRVKSAAENSLRFIQRCLDRKMNFIQIYTGSMKRMTSLVLFETSKMKCHDNQIIEFCERFGSVVLVTQDTNVRLKCKSAGVNSMTFQAFQIKERGV